MVNFFPSPINEMTKLLFTQNTQSATTSSEHIAAQQTHLEKGYRGRYVVRVSHICVAIMNELWKKNNTENNLKEVHDVWCRIL